MKNKLKPSGWMTLLLSLLFFCFSGCAPRYIPNVINAPMLHNKGELQVSANSGTANFSPQLSYAISDHIGLMINGCFAFQDSTDISDLHKVKYGEVATGYFTRIGNRGVFDVYGGYGYGTIKSTYTGWTVEAWNSESDFFNNRFFIQPSIGYSHEIFDLNFATKFSYTTIYKNDVSESSFFITPVTTIKAGYRHAKLIFQLGLSIKTDEDSYGFDYNPFVMNMGLQLDLFRDYE